MCQFLKCHNPTRVRIQINRDSDVPVSEQLAAQLVYLIGSGHVRPGTLLPSVRALALQLRVHRNTVSEAFHDPTLGLLVDKERGRRLRVRDGETPAPTPGLDALIDSALHAARAAGYTQQQLHGRLSERLAAAPPDRVLIVSEDAGLRRLMAIEVRRRLACVVDGCTPDALAQDMRRALGALMVTTPASQPRVGRWTTSTPASGSRMLCT